MKRFPSPGPGLAYKNFSLRTKLLIAYFLLIAAPCGLFAFALLNTAQERLYEAHLNALRQTMQRDAGALAHRLAQIQSYALMFQNDKRMIEYLDLRNKTVADEIISFITELYPLFAYVHSLDPDVSRLTIHSVGKPLAPLPTHILFHEKNQEITDALPMGGLWTVSANGGLGGISYSVPLYNHNYTRRLGYLEIGLWGRLLQDYLRGGAGRQYVEIDGQWHRLLAEGLLPQPGPPEELAGGWLVWEEPVAALNLRYLGAVPNSQAADPAGFRNLLLLTLALFALLSALYYLFLSAFSRRLSGFSAHIAKTRFGSLQAYEDGLGQDEIGRVILSYNQLISRVGQLISDLNIAQLKQDQARLFALQAQIHPHFLYNALETARMMAESAGDEGAADFIYNLGVFIRYAFTAFEDDVSVRRELDVVEKYLQIYKATMGGRLTYQVALEGGAEHLRCPPFMIQPLVENALRHGLGPGGGSITLLVRARLLKDAVEIVVQDDGVGIAPDRLKELLAQTAAGLGIRNVMKRVRNYYGEGGNFTVVSAPGAGTTCVITGQGVRELGKGDLE